MVNKEIIKAHALKNAVEHSGKATNGPIINSLFNHGLKKDKIKDADALLLCNDKKCLRVGPECGAGTAQARIKAQIVDWLE